MDDGGSRKTIEGVPLCVQSGCAIGQVFATQK